MGVLDGFKKVIGIEEIEEDDIATEEEIKMAKEKIINEMPAVEKSAREKDGGSFVPAFNRSSNKSLERKAMSMDKRYSSGGTTALKLLVIEPKNFEECRTLVDNLKAKKPVIVNLEKLETETAKKIFDFLNGAVYALNGNVNKITSNIFIFAPSNVGITESRDDRNTGVNNSDRGPWGK